MRRYDLDKICIGVYVEDTQTTTYFKDPTEAAYFASENINKGWKIKMLYCNEYGCEI